MHSQFIQHHEFRLEYYRHGGGSEILLAFHGYGRDASDMEIFLPYLRDRYTVYAFNFFHHGNSVYPENRISQNTLRVKEWNEIIKMFLIRENIHAFSLWGYSMGGKIILCTLPAFAGQVKNIYLLAPDGLKENFWYSLTARNRLGNRIYRKIIENPEPFFKVVQAMGKMRMVPKKRARFAMYNLETREKRMHVYRVWMTLRLFTPNLKRVAECAKKNRLRFYFYFGKYDNIIPRKLIKKFYSMAGEQCQIKTLECGHNLLTAQAARELQKDVIAK